MLQGRFSFTSFDDNNVRTAKIVASGDFVYINKGTYFQLENLLNVSGKLFWGFIPGERLELVRQLARYQLLVGKNNLNANIISELENKFCVFG